MDFIAIDVETSNSDCSSICQVGVAISDLNKDVTAFMWEMGQKGSLSSLMYS
jgi:hypothetical protein